MELLESFPNLLKTIAEQVGKLGSWFTSEIVNVNGLSITPIGCILPLTLIVILGVVCAKFLLDW